MIAFYRSKTRERRKPIPVASRPLVSAADTPLVSLALYSVLALAIVVGALIDLPRALPAGRMSGLGLVTVIEVLIGLLVLLVTREFPRRLLLLLAPYAAFMAWAALSTAWAPPKTQGLQNAAVYLSLLVLITVAAVSAARDRDATERLIGLAILAADAIGLGLVAASLSLRGWPANIDAVPWFVHPRGLALFGLVPLSWHLARWTLGNQRSALGACLWMAAIFVSLSRTATAAAALLILCAVVARARTPRGASRSNLLLFALVPVVIVGALTVAPFRTRLFGIDRHGVSSGDLQLRDNGRRAMWAGVARSAGEAPLIGKGLGTSESAVSDTYYWVGHPHNDFLRIWHDLGMVGLLLLVTSLAIWWRALWRDFRRISQHASQSPVLQLAALGALVALMLGMLTDNSLVYSFVMGPTAVLVGAGLGGRRRHLRQRKRRDVDAVGAVTGSEAVVTSRGDSDQVSPELEQVAARFEKRRRRRRRS
jgi:O-antigen ligase